MKKIICALIFTMALAAPSFAAEKMIMAIMDFNARDLPRSDALKVSELIRNELINSGAYILIERAQVDKILREQGFQMTGCTDVSCAVQVGKLLSARKILVGTIMKIGDTIAITGRIVDVEKGIDEFGEKVTVPSQNELIDGVERFCNKLTERITGKPVSKKETEKKVSGVKYYSYSYGSTYDAVSDPTLWLGVGSLVAGAVVCIGNAANYKFVVDPLKMQLSGSYFGLAGMAGFPSSGPLLAYFYSDIQSKKAAIRKAENTRNTVYYVAAGLGGFSAIMFISFIGRYVSNTASTDQGAGSIAVVFPEQYFNASDLLNHKKFGFGMGLSMRF